MKMLNIHVDAADESVIIKLAVISIENIKMQKKDVIIRMLIVTNIMDENELNLNGIISMILKMICMKVI